MRPGRGRPVVAAWTLAVLVAVSAATPTRAQSTSDAELAWYLASSTALQAATVFESFGYGEAWLPWALLGTAGAEAGVGLAFGTRDAWPIAGAQLGLSLAFAANELAFGANLATPLLFNSAHKLSMYATYSGYADLRSRSSDPAYAAGFERASFGELALAPFKGASYAPMPVWGYLATMSIFAAQSILSAKPGEAVWDSGSAYLGDREFPVWAGVGLMLLLQVPNFVMTGIGEEALYRGTYYEELSTRLGEWPAKLIDASWFTFSHFPQQWDELMAMPRGQLFLKTALSFVQAFWFQYIYEWHGLEAAVTAHAVSDIVVFFCDWLAYGGVPNAHGFSINERGGLSISFDL